MPQRIAALHDHHRLANAGARIAINAIGAQNLAEAPAISGNKLHGPYPLLATTGRGLDRGVLPQSVGR
jgi:hypothetical protein